MRLASLQSSDEFRSVIRHGARCHGRLATVYLKPADVASASCVRLGLIVGKTVGNAVTRNQVRRRLREIVRHYWQDSTPIGSQTTLPPGELVIRALPAARAASYQDLNLEVTGSLVRLERKIRSVAK